jgi:hypothetical protein
MTRGRTAMIMEPESRKLYPTHILSTQFLCIMNRWEGLGKGMGTWGHVTLVTNSME